MHPLSLCYQNVQLHKVGLLIAKHLIIKRCITSGAGFQRIKEIVNDLIQRQVGNVEIPQEAFMSVLKLDEN